MLELIQAVTNPTSGLPTSPAVWAGVVAVFTACGTVAVKWIVPGLMALRKQGPDVEVVTTGSRQSSSGMATFVGIDDIKRRLDVQDQNAIAEAKAAAEFRMELRGMLMNQISASTDGAREQRVLAEEMTKLATAVEGLQSKVEEIEKRSRGQETAISSVTNITGAIERIERRLNEPKAGKRTTYRAS